MQSKIDLESDQVIECATNVAPVAGSRCWPRTRRLWLADGAIGGQWRVEFS
jgi:hypothetical protein